VEVRRARRPEEIAAALELRERVFAGEQGVPVAADRDGRDDDALHLVAVAADCVVGTCRLVFHGEVAHLGRLAVESAERGRGVGTALLREAERHTRAAGAARISLHAQTHAKALYGRAGFVERGEEFVDEGIPHVAMEKRLA
jgi:predicted GNAT family N-acyltransferase